MSIGYVLHDLSMFSPPEEIQSMLDRLRAELSPNKHIQQDIKELEQALIDAKQLREDLAETN